MSGAGIDAWLAHLDEEVRWLTNEGLTRYAVAKRLGIDRRTVGRALRKQEKT
jgi:DNA-binding transcriptional regulator LsrR (DeoR family)